MPEEAAPGTFLCAIIKIKIKRMKNFNEASFVICLETGEWKTMTDVELRESAERLSELLTQELEGKEGYAERRDFLRDARNRLKLLIVSPRVCGDGEKKQGVDTGVRASVAGADCGQGEGSGGTGDASRMV